MPMKLIAITALTSAAIFVTALTFTGCSSSENSKATTQAAPAAKQYTCTMHPEVVKDKPGKCPKCDMDLVPKP